MEPTNTQIDQQKPRTSPKDFFLHLAVIITLYISSVSLISLIFDIINVTLPDKLSYYADSYSYGIKLAIASLVIIFPLFLLFSWMLKKDTQANPIKTELGIRKWLTYFTLFIAGLTLAIDLVTLVLTFLNGELTLHFVLKVFVVIIVAGAIFGYYIYDLRKKTAPSKVPLVSGSISAVVVLISIIASFIIIGSPYKARQTSFDNTRVQDLANIQYQVINYWQTKSSLPTDLNTLNNQISNYSAPVDPETQEPYVYKVDSDTTFTLCANFDLPTDKNYSNDPYGYSVPVRSGVTNNWQHGSGQTCFDRTIDPDLYPPFNKIGK